MYTGKYRTQTFHSSLGSYVQVFQRHNEKAWIDINFFEGNRDETEAANALALLTEAHAPQRMWNAEPEEG
jgi:hypothetical protein